MEQRLKERLIGAGVLVLAAVIFIPVLLDDSQKTDTTITETNILEKPDGEFSSRLIPLPEPEEIMREVMRAEPEPEEATIADGKDDAVAATPPGDDQTMQAVAEAPTQAATKATTKAATKATTKAATKATTKAATKATTKATTKAATKAATKATTKAATVPADTPPKTPPPPAEVSDNEVGEQPGKKGPTGWVVQMGSFSNRVNADGLNAKLQAAGYPSYVQEVKRKTGVFYKVRIGPEVLRSEASKLKTKLKKEMGLDAILLKYP